MWDLKPQEPDWTGAHEPWLNHAARALRHPRLRMMAHRAPVI